MSSATKSSIEIGTKSSTCDDTTRKTVETTEVSDAISKSNHSPISRDSSTKLNWPIESGSADEPVSRIESSSADEPVSPIESGSADEPVSRIESGSVDEVVSPLTVSSVEESRTFTPKTLSPKPNAMERAPYTDLLVTSSVPSSSSDIESNSTSLSVRAGEVHDTKTDDKVEKVDRNIGRNLEKHAESNSQRKSFSEGNGSNQTLQVHLDDDFVLPSIGASQNAFLNDDSLGSLSHNSPTNEDSPSGISLSSYASAVSQLSPRTVNCRILPMSEEVGSTEINNPKTSVGTQVDGDLPQSNASNISTCSKHKNAVISEEQTPNFLTGTPDLCIGCSKSMLSYILIIQKFLEGLASDICKQIDPLTQCYECVKEKFNLPIQSSSTCKYHDSKESEGLARQQAVSKQRRKSGSSIKTKTQKETTEMHHDNPKAPIEQNITIQQSSKSTYTEKSSNFGQSNFQDELTAKSDQSYRNEPERTTQGNAIQNMNTAAESNKQRKVGERTWQDELPTNHIQTAEPHDASTSQVTKEAPSHKQSQQEVDSNYSRQQLTKEQQYQNNVHDIHQHQDVYYPAQISETQTVNDLQAQPHYPSSGVTSEYLRSGTHDHVLDYISSDSFHGFPSPPPPQGEGTDGILSMLHKVECGLKDTSTDLTIWERIAEIQNQSFERDDSEAFVTIARNNSEALGCLVLGASLLFCGTSKTTCVLISDSVNSDLVDPLSSIFHVVLHTRSLDSIGTTKLSLLDQPELGITFGKLNVWRLEQFTKCVFLNPDTIVIQNCDELFCHEELSAVPDIGWPDCFNSGVFVFKPSDKTFWELLEFADKQRSYDGGEQGLLNSYFSSWSQDISKKLSFIYNLMANVSYTYTPAFKQFGRSVKVVQFLGPFKPWHVKFDNTGQIAQSSTVHPTYVQFVRVWLNTFRICVLPQFSPEIISFASTQKTLSAYELLRFFPSPVGSDTEFLLTPPSVRIRPNMHPLQAATITATAIEKLQLPVTSTPSSVRSPANEYLDQPPLIDEEKIQAKNIDLEENKSKDISTSESKDDENVEDKLEDSTEIEKSVKPKSLIPGAEVGDYQGMSAWEQGRMDYEGTASSDTIIGRLQYLIGKPDRLL